MADQATPPLNNKHALSCETSPSHHTDFTTEKTGTAGGGSLLEGLLHGGRFAITRREHAHLFLGFHKDPTGGRILEILHLQKDICVD